jgi:hypothetical protein
MSRDFNINYESPNEDEMFSYDIENNDNDANEPINKNEPQESLIPPKSILYTVKDDDNITFVIIKIVVMLFMICFVLPFVIVDLYFAYNDKSCVNLYPNKLKISLSIYLQVNSYMMIMFMIIQTLVIFKKIYIYKYNEIIQTIFILLIFIFRIVICGWNIIGALIFWGYVAEKGDCSVIIYNYLFASFVIRILVIALLIANTKNNLKFH